MAATASREQLLAAVEVSAHAAETQDRAGWLAQFTPDGRIEDPVGSQPAVGYTQLGHFYDTFVGAFGIRFHRDLDIAFGTTVLRDLEMVATGLAATVHLPLFLRYDLQESNGQWQIAELLAYWELPAMTQQLKRAGLSAALPALRLSRNIFGYLGLRDTASLMAGARRVDAHKKLVKAFLAAVAKGNKFAALRALSPTATITLGDHNPLDLANFMQQLNGASWTKMNGAGGTVTVSLNSNHGRGIMFADVTRRANAINRIRYFRASSP